MALKEGHGPYIWDTFVKIPGIIASNGTIDVMVDEYHCYKEDVDIMKKMNFDAYRFSISCPRIFPKETGRVNWRGVLYYNRLINYMLKQGITPYANLYHYDVPQALQDEYLGWLSPKIREAYANFADFCFKMFGDRVKKKKKKTGSHSMSPGLWQLLGMIMAVMPQEGAPTVQPEGTSQRSLILWPII